MAQKKNIDYVRLEMDQDDLENIDFYKIAYNDCKTEWIVLGHRMPNLNKHYHIWLTDICKWRYIDVNIEKDVFIDWLNCWKMEGAGN